MTYWFDETDSGLGNGKSYVQFIAPDIARLINDNGWDNFLSYRAKTKDEKKYAEVYLFKSRGSDGEMRKFGMAYGYDTSKNAFNDDRVIFANSELGSCGTGDGSETVFKTKIRPISSVEPVYVYIDDALQPESMYSLNLEQGDIVFQNPPPSGSKITATYKLSKGAPEPPEKLVFFTFVDVYAEKQASEGTGVLKLEDGDGVRTVWMTPTSPIKYGSLSVWVEGTARPEDPDDPEGYTVNYSTGEITFNTAPLAATEITVDYVHTPGGIMFAPFVEDPDGTRVDFHTPHSPISDVTVYQNGNDVTSNVTIDLDNGLVTFPTAPASGDTLEARYTSYGGGPISQFLEALEHDIELNNNFDPTDTESLMGAVYGSIKYLYPSLPTVISFTKDDGFGDAWQRDSYIYYWGSINPNRLFMFIRPDPTGGPVNALFSPLYIGRLHVVGRTQEHLPRKNMVLLGGCNENDEIKWSNDMEIGPNKVDYGEFTSNGDSSVLLQQSIGGSYYQEHYLAYITHDQEVDNGDGRFSPSTYSGKYHLSQIYLAHPNDGYVGKLEDCYAVHPKQIAQLDELEIDDEIIDEYVGMGNGKQDSFVIEHIPQIGTLEVQVDCEVVDPVNYDFDEITKTIKFDTGYIPETGKEVLVSYKFKNLYRYTLATSEISPFTQHPVSPFVPMGVAMFKKRL